MVALLEDELSEFRTQSPVFKLNASAVGKKVVAPGSLIELLNISLGLVSVTNGAFDPGGKGGLSSVGWDLKNVWRKDDDAHLGFGAIGKGYALDRVRVLLEQVGLCDFELNAGGSSILFSGFMDSNTPWNWGWSWKRNSQGEYLGIPMSHYTGTSYSVGVSGTMEQGKHIRDPRKQVAPEGNETALVGHPSAAYSDALSTGLFVAGWKVSNDLFGRLTEKPAMALVKSDGTTEWNTIFQRYWGDPCMHSPLH
jgi:thiamine biosynthesis lipoprotein ApbE